MMYTLLLLVVVVVAAVVVVVVVVVVVASGQGRHVGSSCVAPEHMFKYVMFYFQCLFSIL